MSDVRYRYWKHLHSLVPSNSLHSHPVLSPSLAHVATLAPREWSLAAQQALADCQEVGAVNRQEVCSMIPPLLLLQQNEDWKWTDSIKVLDLCAAPGSKSLQILDQLSPYRCPTLFVCNDTNRQRLLTVSRRSRRQPSHTRRCLLLNGSDGRYFPTLRRKRGGKIKFDRVLVDVPCSGDGTLRKLSATEWQNWNVRAHLHLHRLQVRLLTRALECVAKGGRVVYSTCSLDPIEDEAVLVTAIARCGGPSAYRIVPLPSSLCEDACEKFVHSAGATRWIVPHPQFGKTRKDGSEIIETFGSIDQVPKALRKKEISPSMFPPQARTESNIRAIFEEGTVDAEVKLDQSRFYGEILSDQDMAQFEDMLPNCARILPQHLDSGGFFCAVIERLAPTFYAVCYPSLRNVSENQSSTKTTPKHKQYKYHGRILTNVTSTKHVRELVDQGKHRNDEVLIEGLATLELALDWLKQHRAYSPSLSEEVIVISLTDKSDNGDETTSNESGEIRITKKVADASLDGHKRAPLYTRLLPVPQPPLVAEFCNFFGLLTDPVQAKAACVEVFPADRLVIIGGGDDALTVESCQDPNLAHQLVEINDVLPGKVKVHRKRRFFHMALVSDPVWDLFKGGAKFSPMHVGLGLCWIPIPGYYREHQSSTREGTSEEEKETGEDAASRRAAQSGRFGLMDEAAEYLGQRATKRIFALSQQQAIDLLETSTLALRYCNDEVADAESTWWASWGPARFGDVFEWSSGAIIAAVVCTNDACLDHERSTLFLSCVLEGETHERRIRLVTEQKLADSWARLLHSCV